jgi:carboxypeptidase family protein
MQKLSSLVVVALVSTAQAVGAQSAVLLGTVMRDTLGHALAGGIEIRIPQLGSGATTNYLGEFRITRIPPGNYVVTIRALGYEPFEDSIAFVANQTVTREFVLKPVGAVLAPVQTQAAGAAQAQHRSPALAAFEERRMSGKGGYFIGDSTFRENDSKRLSDVLGRIPGLQKIPDRDFTYMGSSRAGTDGGLVFQKRSSGLVFCAVTVYENGLLRFQGPVSPGNPALDINTINVSDLSGAEFYPGGATLPPQFTPTNTSCGVLLLWTRDR